MIFPHDVEQADEEIGYNRQQTFLKASLVSTKRSNKTLMA